MSKAGQWFYKISSYFGGKYMKYWYVAFAVTVLLMLAFSVSEAKVDKFVFTVYNDDGSIQSERIISKAETDMCARSANSRSIVPDKIF